MKSRSFPCCGSPFIEILEARIAPAFAAAVPLGSLDGTNGFKLRGVADHDYAGSSVSPAGDVNGDGFADLIVGAFGANEGGNGRGAAYVVFGKAGGFGAAINLSALDGTDGFKLSGLANGDNAGISVRAAGDVNGDGFADLIVGAPDADEGGTNRGAAYVVFGKAGGFGAAIDLSALDGSNGFKLSGVANGDSVGDAVSAAGDVNGDGFADLIVGAPNANAGGSGRGAAYVVFGKAGGFGAAINLSALNGTNGFELSGVADGDFAGYSASAAGDMNGDGFADLIVGAFGANEGGDGRGAAYVVFGKAGGFGAAINLSALDGTNGFKLSGVADGDSAGNSVRAAGDVNGDGFSDLIVGAPDAGEGGINRGAAYVVFGKVGGFGAAINLSALDGTNGFKLSGVADFDVAGNSVDAAGDVNGDGFADLIVGAPFADEGGYDRGAAYVVFGKAGGFGAAINLSALDGTNGFKLSGVADSDYAGIRVSTAGDVNGDGFADLLVGAIQANEGGNNRGAAYVIFGQPDVKVAFSKDHKSATFTDTDGDLVSVKVSKGTLSQGDFTFTGGIWRKLNLADDGEEFAGANLNVTVKRVLPAGDGFVNLGAIDAHGLDLGVVALRGDVGQIDAGDFHFKTPAVKSLTVGSLGQASGTQPVGTVNPLVSDFVGALGKLTVWHGSVLGVVNVTGGIGANIGAVSISGDLDGSAGGALAGLLRAGGNIGPVTIGGGITGGADFSGIIAGGKLGKVTIGGGLGSADAAKPVIISAFGDPTATAAAHAVAIAGVSVKLNVKNARILAGYTASLGAANPDASIGPIKIGGSWAASSVAAGVADSTADGLGRHDALIAGDTTPTIFATIAAITIKGTVTGSPAAGDFFGFTAQRLTKLTIGTTTTKFIKGTADDTPLDNTNADFHAVDFA